MFAMFWGVFQEFGFEKPFFITDAWGCCWNHPQRISQEPSDFVGGGVGLAKNQLIP